MRELALDTETTGLDPKSGHRIVEIGCVEMIDKIRTGKTLQLYINPERDMPEEAQRVHGISSKFLMDKPVFAEVAGEFVDFIGDDSLVIHNAGFDMKFLNHELQLLGFPVLSMSRATCTVVMARKKFPGSPASLDALCRRFNIDLSSRTKHGALLDAELLSDVYLELCGGRQGAIAFSQEEAAKKAALDDVRPEYNIPVRSFTASREEAENHKEFVASLEGSLWAEYS